MKKHKDTGCSAKKSCVPYPSAAFFFVIFALVNSFAQTQDSVYYFYQRTVYLDNPLMDGAWYSNPSSISTINKPEAFTVNAGTLGRRYTISSVRFFFPIVPSCAAGVGISGASNALQDASFQATEQGTTYQSNFSFTRPSFEAGIAIQLPFDYRWGLLESYGIENDSFYNGGNTQNYFIWGNGLGLTTPEVAHLLSFSFSTFSVGHFQPIAWWENDAKLGMILNYHEDLIRAAAEYSFSLADRFILFRNANVAHGYEVFKVLLSARILKIIGVLAGYSSDTPILSDNGKSVHLGLELRKTDFYSFFGGYDVGISVTEFPQIIHRIWFGYQFGLKNSTSKK